MNLKKDQPLACPPLAWAEIDLKALAHNVAEIKQFAGNRVRILAVVKAQCYGHGLIEIVKVLDKKGIELFGVSDLNEAIAIRRLKIKKPILMLENALPSSAKYLVDYGITPVVCTLELARALNKLGKEQNKKILIHVKVDTGMGRMGVWREEALDFLRMMRRFAFLEVEGICTHFPVAETDVPFTQEQVKQFLDLAEQIDRYIFPVKYVHAANSLGLIAYQQADFNVARTGLMLYGLYPSPAVRTKLFLKPLMSVKSRICFLKHVFAGRKISYGHTFTAEHSMRIATVSIGYSDGYLRTFSNKAYVLVRGVRCPVIGTVTMDQIMVDVTKVKGVKVGDEVCVLGTQGRETVSAEELATIAGTINYEITCSLGSRLARIYK